MRRAPVRVLAVLVTGFLLLAGCGDDGGGGDAEDASGTGSASSAASSGDDEDEPDQDEQDDGEDEQAGSACDLLTTDDVAELLGRDVEDGELSEEDGATSCEWATVEPSESVGEPITLEVEVGDLTDEVSAQLDAALADEANEPLDFGDRSVLVCGLGADGADCTSFDTVAAAVGEQYVEVDLSNWGYPEDYSEDEGDQITQDAAERVVDALA